MNQIKMNRSRKTMNPTNHPVTDAAISGFDAITAHVVLSERERCVRLIAEAMYGRIIPVMAINERIKWLRKIVEEA